jgi:tRNA(fMet)-specific endonuclease VapC
MSEKHLDFVADSSAIICFCRGDSPVKEMLKDKQFAITFVTMAEISHGALKATNKAAWLQVVKSILGQTIFYVSPTTPTIYANIRLDLERRGVTIPTNDIWIAALAVEAKLPLLAHDEHFSRVSGLAVIKC